MSRTGSTALLAVLVLTAGCSVVQPAGDGGGAEAPGAAAADTGDAARPDTVPEAGPAAPDSALRALRDSARARRARRGHAADSARDDTAGARREPVRAEGEEAYPHGPVRTADVDSLAELGPVYTPYDRGPVMRTGDHLDGLLRAALVPVIRDHDLSPETWSRFWVLVDAEGRVREATLHVGSGHAAFDAASEAVAERLRYLPAEREGEPVPVWVLTRVSLLMG